MVFQNSPDLNAPYKSQGEKWLAEFFEKNDLMFWYEYPVAVMDRGKAKIWYPDFLLPDFSVIVEYFGMSGLPEYDKQTEHKKAVYERVGIDGIYLSSESFRQGWEDRFLNSLESILDARNYSFKELKTYHQQNHIPHVS